MKPFKNFSTKSTEMKFFGTDGKEYFAQKSSTYWELFVKEYGAFQYIGSIKSGRPTPKKMYEYLA